MVQKIHPELRRRIKTTEQNGQHFADGTITCISWNENNFLLKFNRLHSRAIRVKNFWMKDLCIVLVGIFTRS